MYLLEKMYDVMYNVVLMILVINAIFWGLGSHKDHCSVASYFGMKECPPHIYHILLGVLFFFMSIVVAQSKYILF